MDGSGTDALLLPEVPVEEVSAVTVADWADVEGYPTRFTTTAS